MVDYCKQMYEEDTIAYKILQSKIFVHSNEISSTDWQAACRSIVVGQLDKLREFKALKLQMLKHFYDWQIILNPNFIVEFDSKWIFLSECIFDNNMNCYGNEDDAFDAGCAEMKLPPIVFTVKVSNTPSINDK